MAKSLLFSSTILFFLFTSTFARLQVDLPENDFTTTTFATADLTQLPESNIKTTTIILPSEKPETEPATYVELEPEEIETFDSNRLPQTQETEISSASENEKTETVESDPLTVVTFRPINKRPLYRFGRGRGCHGRRRHRFNQLKFKHDQGQRQDQTQGLRSYGNDMILSTSEDLGFDRHISAKWPRFSHEGHKASFMNKEARSEEINIKPRFHHHHHHFHHHDHHEEEGEMKEHHRHDEYYFKGGFMKGIRKFLNHF